MQLYIYHNTFLSHALYRNQFAFYLVYTAIMTLALVLAARKSDPLDYNEGIDIFRGLCEAVIFLFVIYNVCREGYQLKKYIGSSIIQFMFKF